MLSTSRCLLLLVVLSLPGAVLAQPAGWSTDPTAPLPICTTPYYEQLSKAIADDAGGAYLVWTDSRNGQWEVWVQHVDADGTPTWIENGIQSCTYDSDQSYYDAVADGAGGLIVVWRDEVDSVVDIYAQRFDTSGRVWADYGVAVCTVSEDQTYPKVLADGSGTGGCFVVWSDYRDGNADVYAQRLDATGQRRWTTGGVAVCVHESTQAASKLVTDDSGGFIVFWRDLRTASTYALRQQHVDGDGSLLWSADGLSVTGVVNSGYDQYLCHVIPDGAGGTFASVDQETDIEDQYTSKIYHLDADGARLWDRSVADIAGMHTNNAQLVRDDAGGVYAAATFRLDYERAVIAQHFSATGIRTWTTAGVAVCGISTSEYVSTLLSDGSGGLLIVTNDYRYGAGSVIVHRLNTSGDHLWDSDGALVGLGFVSEMFAAVATPDGGAIVLMNDYTDLYAGRIGPLGYLADPRPVITAVADVPDDQGGEVTVTWQGSYLDSQDDLKVTEYSVWMRTPESKTRRLDEAACAELAVAHDWSLDRIDILAKAGWGYVDVVPAMQEAEYFAFGPTFGDSTAGGIPRVEYRIVAHTTEPFVSWESLPVSGYSVDNLAPGVLLTLGGEAHPDGDIDLAWTATGTPDADLAGYVVYRGDTPGFALDTEHVIDRPQTPSCTDHPGPGDWFYRVTARDVHDNEGVGSNELTVGSLSPAPEVADAFALHGNFPNPFNPRTAIAFDLPRDSQVALTVYALDGTRVATLVQQILPAGYHEVPWNGCDDRGKSVAAGVYAYRLQAGDLDAIRTMVLVR